MRVGFGIWEVCGWSVLSGFYLYLLQKHCFWGVASFCLIDVLNCVAIHINSVATEAETEIGQRVTNSVKNIVQ